jgi:acetyl-CoA carboxylase biotin carboxyl carrier protein
VHEVRVAAGDQYATADERGVARVTSEELVAVQRQVLELLARLSRPPQKLRISAGTVTLDLSWADETTGAVGPPVSSPVGPAVTPASAVAEDLPVPHQEYLRSPAVGVFYHASEPGGEPFVSVGSTVGPGQQIGVVEAMKLMIPVEADRAGRITAVVRGNGEPVEYGEELFAIEDPEA